MRVGDWGCLGYQITFLKSNKNMTTEEMVLIRGHNVYSYREILKGSIKLSLLPLLIFEEHLFIMFIFDF